MRAVILLGAVLAVAAQTHDPNADAQYINIKAVKGGGGQYHYRGGDYYNRFNNNSTQGSYGVTFNHTGAGAVAASQRVGICIIEVPTASLARDPKHVPAGNGSRSDLSRVETCCAGYIRNIHNFRLCDPVCTTECVNALCTAPNTCTCFPDHVKNNAGFCVATCPIGCQNGHCAGGECLCKEGFKLDRNGRFCEPYCRENCGGIGNCTAPNTCTCRPGFHSTPQGSCREGTGPASQQQSCGSCINGDCVGTECRCRQGSLLYKGECLAQCYPSCGPNTKCVAPNVCAPSSGPNQPNNTSQFPNQVTVHQYPYPNQPQNNVHGQNPSQYPNGQYPNGQHPQNQNNTNIGQYPYGPNPYSQNPNNKPPSSVYAQYPGGQPNQYPQQPGQYPQPNLNHGQYPQQPGQHLYPVLPQSQYPYPNQPNTTDGQTFHQTNYNPLENQTFNLHLGPQNHTQGSQGSQGQFGQGQQGSQGQFSSGQYGAHGQNTQGQYESQGQFSSGQYEAHGQNSQGQYGSQGQFSQGQQGYQGQFSQGQQGSQGQYSSGQYGAYGQNSQGQYGSQGEFSQGQHGSQGQFSQGQSGTQGQYGQGQFGSQGQHGHAQVEVYGHPGQFVPQGQDQTLNWPNQGQCAQPCINGTCVGGNRCECLPGYVQDPADATGTRCQPYCHGGCHNGFCTAPNTCACDAGYHKDFSVKGRSVCIKRERRSIEEKPINVAELLVFEIPDY